MTEFVPALHCNQSSLEATFSSIRHLGKDRIDVYGTGILLSNIQAFTQKNVKVMKLHHLPIEMQEKEGLQNYSGTWTFNLQELSRLYVARESEYAMMLSTLLQSKKMRHTQTYSQLELKMTIDCRGLFCMIR